MATAVERARMERAFGMQGRDLFGEDRNAAALIQYAHPKPMDQIGLPPNIHRLRDARLRLSVVQGVVAGAVWQGLCDTDSCGKGQADGAKSHPISRVRHAIGTVQCPVVAAQANAAFDPAAREIKIDLSTKFDRKAASGEVTGAMRYETDMSIARHCANWPLIDRPGGDAAGRVPHTGLSRDPSADPAGGPDV